MAILDPTRAERLTASCFPIPCGDNTEAQQRLFLQLSADPRHVADDFSESWTARFGRLVEPFALDFRQKKTGCVFTSAVNNSSTPTALTFPARWMPTARPTIARSMSKILMEFADLNERLAYMRQLLTDWSICEADAKAHDAAKVKIKLRFPDDCGRLTYSGFIIARARNGAVHIKRLKERK